MALLTRDGLLAATSLPTEDVQIPTGTARVRGLSGRGRDEFEASVMTGKGEKREVSLKNLRAKLIVRSVVDESGALVFKPEDEDAVGNMSAVDADLLFSAAQRLSGMTKKDVDDLGKASSDVR